MTFYCLQRSTPFPPLLSLEFPLPLAVICFLSLSPPCVGAAAHRGLLESASPTWRATSPVLWASPPQIARLFLSSDFPLDTSPFAPGSLTVVGNLLVLIARTASLPGFPPGVYCVVPNCSPQRCLSSPAHLSCVYLREIFPLSGWRDTPERTTPRTDTLECPPVRQRGHTPTAKSFRVSDHLSPSSFFSDVLTLSSGQLIACFPASVFPLNPRGVFPRPLARDDCLS